MDVQVVGLLWFPDMFGSSVNQRLASRSGFQHRDATSLRLLLRSYGQLLWVEVHVLFFFRS